MTAARPALERRILAAVDANPSRIPVVLGGGRTPLLGNVIQNQFTQARDWPFGAALGVVFLALFAAAFWLSLAPTAQKTAASVAVINNRLTTVGFRGPLIQTGLVAGGSQTMRHAHASARRAELSKKTRETASPARAR